MELVDIARLCPSSANIQPLCYYLAWEPDEVARIQEQTRWAGAITHMKLPHLGMEPPAFIVILQDTKINDSMTRIPKGCRNCGTDYAFGSRGEGAWRLHDRKLSCAEYQGNPEP